jgi:hypothetical protein
VINGEADTVSPKFERSPERPLAAGVLLSHVFPAERSMLTLIAGPDLEYSAS